MKLRPQTLLGLFLLGLTLFRLAIIGKIPLTPDEAYYWTWSRRPAICYYDQPGMIAWVHWLFAWLFPEPTPFSVRFPAVLMALLTSWISYRAYRVFHDHESEAVALIMALSILPIFFLGGLIIVHDNALFLFLALSYFLALKLLRQPRAFLWYLLALALTASLYTKFSALMVAACFAAFVPLSPTLRPWLRRPHPYLAGLTAAVLYSPALLWNYRHDWVSFHAVAELTRTESLSLVDRFSYALEFLASQLGAYSPLLWFSLIAGLVVAARRYFKERDEFILLLLMLSVPILLYFFIQSFRSHVFGNWAAVGYFPAFILTVRLSASFLRLPFPAPWCFRRRYLALGLFLALILSLAPVVQARYQLFSPAFRRLETLLHLDNRIDQRLDQELSGWSELGSALQRVRSNSDFLLARRYQIASILEFYLPDHPQVQIYSQGRRASQFDLWTDLNLQQGQNALYVDVKPIPPALLKHFSKVVPLAAPLKIMDQGQTLKRFFIYRAEGYQAESGGTNPSF